MKHKMHFVDVAGEFWCNRCQDWIDWKDLNHVVAAGEAMLDMAKKTTK